MKVEGNVDTNFRTLNQDPWKKDFLTDHWG